MYLIKLIHLVYLIFLINTKESLPKKNISKEIDNNNYLIINKINLKQKFYSINSEENTIEKNIEILKESTMPNKDNSILIIAAHSGTGDIAYFNNLDKLELNDKIKVIYNNKNYIYIVTDIYEENKNGYINIHKENTKQLILTTCHPNKPNKQLIISAKTKES